MDVNFPNYLSVLCVFIKIHEPDAFYNLDIRFMEILILSSEHEDISIKPELMVVLTHKIFAHWSACRNAYGKCAITLHVVIINKNNRTANLP